MKFWYFRNCCSEQITASSWREDEVQRTATTWVLSVSKTQTGLFSPAVRRHGREAGHILPCRAEGSNEWSYTSTPPYSFMVCTGAKFTVSYLFKPVVCLTTGPQLLPKRVLHRVRSGASSFNFQYCLVSVRSPSSCLRLHRHLNVTSFYLSINNVFHKAVPTQDVTSPVSLHSLCMYIPLLLGCN